MASCPKCRSTLVKQDQCEYCDWVAEGKAAYVTPAGSKRKSPHEDRQNSQCNWNDFGLRCEAPGSISTSTDGSGPWYCRKHFWHDSSKHDPVSPEVGKANAAHLMAELVTKMSLPREQKRQPR